MRYQLCACRATLRHEVTFSPHNIRNRRRPACDFKVRIFAARPLFVLSHPSRRQALLLEKSQLDARTNSNQCSRNWPCNHCCARRLSHLCRFSTRMATASCSSPIDTPRSALFLCPHLPISDYFHARKLQSRLGSDFEAENEFSVQCEMSAINSADGFKAWGYMPGHQHFQLGYVALQVGSHPEYKAKCCNKSIHRVLAAFSTAKDQSSLRRSKVH